MNTDFWNLFFGAVALLAATAWMSDRGVDLVVAWWSKRRTVATGARRLTCSRCGRDFGEVARVEERRRIQALRAIAEDGR